MHGDSRGEAGEARDVQMHGGAATNALTMGR